MRSGENGAEALELVTENTDVVLLDLQMPVLDGFGALERLGREHPGVPAVVLTSVDDAAEALPANRGRRRGGHARMGGKS